MSDPSPDAAAPPVLVRLREGLTSWAALTVVVALIAGGLMLWIAADASEVLRSASPVPAAVVDQHSPTAGQSPALATISRQPERRSVARRAGRSTPVSRSALVAIAPSTQVLQIARSTIPASSAPVPSQPSAPPATPAPSPSPSRPASPPPSTPESSSPSGSSSSGDRSKPSPDASSTSSAASSPDSGTSTSSGSGG